VNVSVKQCVTCVDVPGCCLTVYAWQCSIRPVGLYGQGRINHSGVPYQRNPQHSDQTPFLIRVAMIFSEGTLFPKKVVVVVAV